MSVFYWLTRLNLFLVKPSGEEEQEVPKLVNKQKSAKENNIVVLLAHMTLLLSLLKIYFVVVFSLYFLFLNKYIDQDNRGSTVKIRPDHQWPSPARIENVRVLAVF